MDHTPWTKEVYCYFNDHPLVKTVYDWSRQSLNFEINVHTGEVQPIDIKKPRLEERWNTCIEQNYHDLQYSIHPETGEVEQILRPIQKTDIKLIRLTIGGVRKRLYEMAFDRPVEMGKEGIGKNGDVKRKGDIEDWAVDCFQWICAKFGKENILTFVVHLDEITPHIHCDLVPLVDGSLSYNKMFALNRGKASHNQFVKEIHNSFLENVCAKWDMNPADIQEEAEHQDKMQNGSPQEKRNYRTLQTKISNLDGKLEKGIIDYTTYKQLLAGYKKKLEAIVEGKNK